MTLRRASGDMIDHAPISSRVRPQPKQKPVFMSMAQTRTQGDSIMVMIEIWYG
jgi:nicotinate-nucleotide--dimethylbenzimidazole phosphoribosyltransferase